MLKLLYTNKYNEFEQNLEDICKFVLPLIKVCSKKKMIKKK